MLDSSGSVVSWFTSVLLVQKFSTAWSISNSASCSPKFIIDEDKKHRAPLPPAIEQVILIEFMSQTWVMSNSYGISVNQVVAPKKSSRHGDDVAEANSDQAGSHDSKSNFESRRTGRWWQGPVAEGQLKQGLSNQQKHLLGWHLLLLHVCLQ